MKLEAIYEFVGLSVEQIREAARKASTPRGPVEPTVTPTPESARPICKVCGRPVGKWTCWPGPSVRMNRITRTQFVAEQNAARLEKIREAVRGEFPPL